MSSLAAFFSMKFAKAMVCIPLSSSAGIAGKPQPTKENRSASPATQYRNGSHNEDR
ncbi:hypothetical protein JK174_11560 [Acetobacter thailandicus]|uniref:Uncharacterized protein n=1 Tax=Acetobacter thailandicus TaxID=1502842 RepID=A0ABT3QHD7_9PROT|nr:hypothetical protein [Acetobacter thailandicus]MBS0959726.1 hypothetical protein [Acetobacter thailandicus]MBS0981396.1 hypothetical protein [Acetobacter thailandicus]MCX2564715.1 hypothetical protein [Acetobacter thailandicus]